MNSYIFVTSEGHTFQPNSESSEPDIENCQVIGFASGNTEKQAFANLVCENSSLLETAFDELICFELKHIDCWHNAQHFSLHDIKTCC